MSKKPIVKKKGLFDHINAITTVENQNYWEELSEENKKTYSTYMVNRFLSMKIEWIDFVNDVQKYWDVLTPREHYKVYADMLPKGRQFLKYIKKDKDMNLPKWFMEIFCRHYECSAVQVKGYLETLLLTEQGTLEIREILTKHGVEPKKWRELPFEIR